MQALAHMYIDTHTLSKGYVRKIGLSCSCPICHRVNHAKCHHCAYYWRAALCGGHVSVNARTSGQKGDGLLRTLQSVTLKRHLDIANTVYMLIIIKK